MRQPINFRKDYRKTWYATRRSLNKHRGYYGALMGLVLLAALFAIHPHDRTILDTVQGEKEAPVMNFIAIEAARWGDFIVFNLCGACLIWTVGYFRRSRWVQRLAYATLFGAILAGIFCNVFRLTVGRARPAAGVEDRFYGFEGSVKGWRYHGFPSGHTSTAFGAAAPIITAAGVWGAPMVVASGTVGWSRLYKNQHYPTDVLVGAALGVLFGIATGAQLRKVRLRMKRRRWRSTAMTCVVPERIDAVDPELIAKTDATPVKHGESVSQLLAVPGGDH